MSGAEEHLTLQEAAELLGVHYMTAYRYVRLGLVPADKVGSTWRLARADVEAMRRGSGVGEGRRHPAPWPERMEARLSAGDEAGAWGVAEAALAAGADATGLLLDVLGPALRRIGDSWEAGRLDVAEEHRASVIAGRLVGRLGSRFPRRGRSKGTVVVGAVAGERHGLPVTFVADVVRGAGWSVVDLGADVPDDSFARLVAEQDHVVAVGLSVTWDGNVEHVPATVAAVRRATTAPVLVGGRAVADDAHAHRLGADAWAPDGRGVVALLTRTRDGSSTDP
jgi:excisionase family DNA binding protein